MTETNTGQGIVLPFGRKADVVPLPQKDLEQVRKAERKKREEEERKKQNASIINSYGLRKPRGTTPAK